MLLEIALADAYGAGFEFQPATVVAASNTLTRYVPHGLHPNILGRYTDDTQMTIAIAECLMAGTAFDRRELADAFVRVFLRDPRDGYAQGFRQVLSRCRSGDDLLATIRPNSTRNGAAMRSVPLGILDSPARVLEAAALQASITHDTPIGRASSQAVALVAHLGLRLGGALSDVPEFLAAHQLDEWDLGWGKPVSVEAFDTVSAVLSALLRHRSMAALLQSCVAFQGDTDSVAAIAVGLASCFPDYDNDLPTWLVTDLDEPTYGVEYLDQLNAGLLATNTGEAPGPS